MAKSSDYYEKIIAKANEDLEFHESEEEKLLWEKRGRMEKKIEQNEKMIRNARERLDYGRDIGVFERLEQEIGIMQEETSSIRVKITFVDRQIRAVEKGELAEGREKAEATDLAAKEAKEYTDALGQARQRIEMEVRTIRELERKLKEIGKM